ncbi:MAG TPA: DJ-1/PfpI family protein [Candidatus Eremiobacteraceae bacterium]|nr:DJ-1/PfpI family protein [Candidatus Eremiobacteraceae bacterium]
MRSRANGFWIAAVIVGFLNLMVPLCNGQAPDKAASSTLQTGSLKPPAAGKINVAILISEGADVLDIAGTWEVFGGAMLTSKGKPWHQADGDDMVMPFNVYTVSDSLKPVDANRLMIVPNYSFDNAPKPQVIVIPAQRGRSAAQKAWLLANSATADQTMSVCTGAEVLAEYGMLDGQTATTHHMFLQSMQKQYPAVHFVSGTRYVENGKIATAAGLTSGIDLALHVVAKYYGDEVARVTADILELRSGLWKNPEYDEVKPVAASK